MHHSTGLDSAAAEKDPAAGLFEWPMEGAFVPLGRQEGGHVSHAPRTDGATAFMFDADAAVWRQGDAIGERLLRASMKRERRPAGAGKVVKPRARAAYTSLSSSHAGESADVVAEDSDGDGDGDRSD